MATANPANTATTTRANAILAKFQFDPVVSGVAIGGKVVKKPAGPVIESYDPATGEVLARVRTGGLPEFEAAVETAQAAFKRWRRVPAPRRGELMRQLGHALRDRKEDLARLTTLENGKIISEGRGEVQEAIDIADFAVGLSRQLYGLAMHSERPDHRMYEQWHPLGICAEITSFNFPVAPYFWGSMIAGVCGDSVIWKPSSSTPLVAIAIQQVIDAALNGTEAAGVFNLVVGPGGTVGEAILRDPRIPLVQATGSCAMGQRVAQVVGARFGRTILELGGNNAIVVLDDLDDTGVELAVRAIVFAAAGTAGQRCTTARRLLVQRGIADRLVARLVRAYRSIPIGDPLDESTLMGPLISQAAVDDMRLGLDKIRGEGGEILTGGGRLDRPGYFVEPTIVRANRAMTYWHDELFAPVLSVFEVADLDEAIELNNAVPQGLSSSLFTTNLCDAEQWLAAGGSDCGIANVNIGTSGAEIGGAFGGTKSTGWGVQSGSDAWKGYMRRQTCTINYGATLPLAQGVRFEVDG